MKVFLAAVEDLAWFDVANLAKANNVLFSYFYNKNLQPAHREQLFQGFNRANMEVICDSGLFTLMFGAGSGQSYDFTFMEKYADEYIAAAKTFGINKLTIVECDVHKILGMDAVFSLRKKFENCGLNVMYVWHREEGIDGLIRMAEKYEYIALSVPELRILFKNKITSYQHAVHDLLMKIRKAVKRMPKVHLLGNTVQNTMETTLAYSCDSTSWKAPARYARGILFTNNILKPVLITENEYALYRDCVKANFKTEWNQLSKNARSDKHRAWSLDSFITATAFRKYQDYLDLKFPWVGQFERNKSAEK